MDGGNVADSLAAFGHASAAGGASDAAGGGAKNPAPTAAAASAATAAASRRITKVDTAVVQRICSDQVIVDLPSALKELLENALDAGATRIDVRLKEHGVELLEVSDNGSGIAPAGARVRGTPPHDLQAA